MNTLTGRQVRAARAVLGWSAKELAERSGLGVTTISRFEKVDHLYERVTVQTVSILWNTLNDGLQEIDWHLTETGGIDRMPTREPKLVEN